MNHPAGGFKPLLPVQPDTKECNTDGDALCFAAGKQHLIFRLRYCLYDLFCNVLISITYNVYFL